MTETIKNKETDSVEIRRYATHARSKVANGGELLPGVDGRTKLARRVRDVLADLVHHLGGADMITAAELELARRAAGLVALTEAQEALAARGEAISLNDYVRLINALRGILVTLGLERRARDVTPIDPLSYARAKSQQSEATDDDS